MSDTKQPAPSRKQTATEKLSELFTTKLSNMKDKLDAGEGPLSEDVEELERLTKAKEFFAKRNSRRRKKYELIVLCLAALLFGVLSFIRLRSTPADIEIYTTKVHLTLDAQPNTTLIPGETGQILSLKQARVSGADSISPPAIGENGSFEIRQLIASDDPKLKMDPEELAVRLQEISLPEGLPDSIAVGVAYDADLRGLTIETSGSQPVTAIFGQVVPVGNVPANSVLPHYAIRSIRADGKNLDLELLPTKGDRELTVFRDIHLSHVTFEDAGHSTILSGTAYIKGAANSNIQLQPSDRFTIQSDAPMLLRELTLTKGELKATLSVPQARILLLGDESPRNLIPTLFQWIVYRWPNQLYATLSALVAAWLAIRHWMGSSE